MGDYRPRVNTKRKYCSGKTPQRWGFPCWRQGTGKPSGNLWRPCIKCPHLLRLGEWQLGRRWVKYSEIPYQKWNNWQACKRTETHIPFYSYSSLPLGVRFPWMTEKYSQLCLRVSLIPELMSVWPILILQDMMRPGSTNGPRKFCSWMERLLPRIVITVLVLYQFCMDFIESILHIVELSLCSASPERTLLNAYFTLLNGFIRCLSMFYCFQLLL